MYNEVENEFFDESSKGEIKKLLCLRCRRQTNHEVKHSFREKWHAPDIATAGTEDFFITQCKGCDYIQFCKVSSNSEDVEPVFNAKGEIIDVHYFDTTKQYPPFNDAYESPLMYVSIPSEIKEPYSETSEALAANLNKLSAIGIRLTLEMICKDNNVRGRTLELKIEGLRKADLISQDMESLLHKIRIFGNDGAHSSFNPSIMDLKHAWEALNTLLRYLYGTKDTKMYFSKKYRKK